VTVVLCVALALSAGVCERGGHATHEPWMERGGQAGLVLEPTGPVSVWVCIHQKEAAWNDTGDPYWGGLQMDRSFMAAYGADMIRRYRGFADRWSPRDQMVVAWRAVTSGRGYGPWPNTRRGCA